MCKKHSFSILTASFKKIVTYFIYRLVLILYSKYAKKIDNNIMYIQKSKH